MNALETQKDRLFSFTYGGTGSEELLRACEPEVAREEKNGVITTVTVYKLADGLEIRQTLRDFTEAGALEWKMEFCNRGGRSSLPLEKICDCDVRIPFSYDPKTQLGWAPGKDVLTILNPAGSNWQRDEYVCREARLFPGEEKYYAPALGRSSQTNTPFFDLNKNGQGVLLAVGWSGQWCATFTRDDETVRIRSGLEDCAFYLYPGEEVRTTSVLLMPYSKGQDEAHNRFRRVIKQYFSLIGQPGRPEEAPLSFTMWGGVSTERMLERLEALHKLGLGYEYFWIDAGWYGQVEQYCPSEFHPGWSEFTGDWEVNRRIHPKELEDVAASVKEKGMKFLLWLEPERVVSTTRIAKEHPEWFLTPPGGSGMEKENWLLLNLAREDVLEYAVETVAHMIRKLDLKCYRQDFNMDPLPFWQLHEEPGRKGIMEIKHITNLYRFWDTLLERFPDLIIDNCASGGKRIDLETIKRSVPLWRSDYQCTFDHDSETTQIHNTGISWWLPYSGTGTGFRSWDMRADTYRYRSSYTAALVSRFEENEDPLHEGEPEQIRWLKERLEEYKEIRPYFSCDFYSLVPLSLDDSSWTVWQYDRPERGDGIVMLFRRRTAPFDRLTVYPRGLIPEAKYRFVCRDTGEESVLTGEQAQKQGLQTVMGRPSESRLWQYSRV